MEINFKDLKPQANEDEAFVFLTTLHRDTSGYIGLNLMSGGIVRAAFETGAGIREELECGRFFSDMIENGTRQWNIYVSMGGFSQRPDPGSRGYAVQVGEIPGLWADFDVKPGQADAFQTVEELDQFLQTLPEMTMRVDTGSGGVHGYWLFEKPFTDMKKARKYLAAWHAYLCAQAGGKVVDNVQELARVLRIAGTVRWPKPGEDRLPAVVRLVNAQGPRYTPEELWEKARGDFFARQKAHKEKTQAWQAQQKTRHNEVVESGFVSEQTADDVERIFNDLQDWAVLLERAGWTLHKDNRDGTGGTAARYWSQPGMTSGNSAMTDYNDSKMMVFYTTHPDWDAVTIPGLEDRSGRRMTTKFHFALGALFAGDAKALIMAIVKGGGVLA